MDASHLGIANQPSSDNTSVKVVVGAVTGSLAMIGVAFLVTGMAVYVRRRRRKYERVPLISDK